jgi:phage-related protein (TIGR01555 family)
MITHSLETSSREDSVLQNVVTGLGTKDDKAQYTGITTTVPLLQQQQEELSGVFPLNNACSAFPYEAIRGGWDLTFGSDQVDPQIIEAFNKYRDVIGGERGDDDMSSEADVFAYASYLANVHGGSAVIIIADDGRSPNEPLNRNNIRSIRGLEVVDRYKIVPNITMTTDPHKVEHYDLLLSPQAGDRLNDLMNQRGSRSRIKSNTTFMGAYYRIHRSRIIRFPGVRVPQDMMRNKYQGWDKSLVDFVFDAYRDWKMTVMGVNNLIQDYSLFIWKLKGLKNIGVEEDREIIRNRMRLQQMMMSVLGGMAVDADDEDVQFLTRSFAGIPELIDKFRDILIGATGIPHTVLFGESPSGLGATGESEEKNWAKQVLLYQKTVFYRRLLRLYQLIWLAKDGPTKGKEPKGWDIKFRPILIQSEAERMESMEKFANILNSAVSGGWMLKDEARKPWSTAEPTYSIDLDEELWKKQQEQEQDDGGFDFGFGDFDFDNDTDGSEGDDTGLLAEGETTDELPAKEQQMVTDSLVTPHTDEDLLQKAIASASTIFTRTDSNYYRLAVAKSYNTLYQQKYGVRNRGHQKAAAR